MSDTPRTDAAIWQIGGGEMVCPKFARYLERELNAANARIDLLEACNADVARIAQERNEALDRIKRLEEAGDHMALYATIGVIAWNSAKKAKP